MESILERRQPLFRVGDFLCELIAEAKAVQKRKSLLPTSTTEEITVTALALPSKV